MSDFPFSIPRRGDADVVNGVSYAGTTLTLTRAEGSDLTTTIATSDPTKIENGTSKMEIENAAGACVFTPAGLTARKTTFAADGNIATNGGTPGDGGYGLNVIGDQQIRRVTGNGSIELKLNNAGLGNGSGGGLLLQSDQASFNNTATIDTWKSGVSSNCPIIIKTLGTERMKFNHGGNITMASALAVTGTVSSNGTVLTSDDRIKENEKLIVNATESLSKLTPQIYDKYLNMDLSGSSTIESGLIAQEVYYNAPELRHLVVVGKDYDTSGNEYTPTPEEMDLSGVDIGSDPDYGSHGWSKTEQAGLHYQGLIPYLIKSNQEMAERLAALENK